MSRTAPLRRIIGYVGMPFQTAKYLRSLELLECGHAQAAVKDIYGETNATRRRCRGCALGREVVPELAKLVASWKEGGSSEMIRVPDVLNTGYRLIG